MTGIAGDGTVGYIPSTLEMSSAAHHSLSEPGTRAERRLALLLFAAAILYMCPFVSRGWIPHDEGMIGQTAERTLTGQRPHVQFEEPYTGALTWVHAGLFKLFGTDLLYPRWLLFAAALASQVLIYVLLRRHFRPLAASFGVWIAVAWSFPNYFAAVPSWWLLACALLSLWSLIRYYETKSLPFASLAGLAVGMAVIIKQTGVYLIVPVMMSVWLASVDTARTVRPKYLPLVARGLASFGGILVVSYLMHTQYDAANVSYLAVPAAAVCVSFALSHRNPAFVGMPRVLPLLSAVLGVALPVGAYILPYILNGEIGAFVHGTLILPRERLAFASMRLPPAEVMVTIILMAAAMIPVRLQDRGRDRLVNAARWCIAGAAVLMSLSSPFVYQIVWQSTRSFVALIPVIAALLLALSTRFGAVNAFHLFAASSMLAWAALVQFPFGAPIYFCYVAPLALLAGAVVIKPHWPSVSSYVRPWAALLLIFAMLSMNRSDPFKLGVLHEPVLLDTPLGLAKATLDVSRDDANIYRRVTSLIEERIGTGRLLAGPDAPEVYFLADRFSPSGEIFDFFSYDDGGYEAEFVETAQRIHARVVVVNHRPRFTPPLSDSILAELRAAFPGGEVVGHFEVRWR